MSTPQKRVALADPSFYDKIVSKTKKARRQLRLNALAQLEVWLAELKDEIVTDIADAADRGETNLVVHQPEWFDPDNFWTFLGWVTCDIKEIRDERFVVSDSEDHPDAIVITWPYDA